MSNTLLKSVFGHDDFRPGQKELIDAVQNGRDVLGVMATGSGKSLCYQFPAVESKKRCLVVSPLISLMNDQVKKLELAGITAAGLHSHAGPHERQRALADWAAKRLRFMYVSPERFSDDGFATALAGSRPDLGCREQKTLPGGVAADQLDERPGQETRARGHHGCRLA